MVVRVFGISALGRLRQVDCKFKASLDYVVRPCLKIKNKQQQQKKQNSGATSHVRLVLQVRLPQQMLIARQEA
jgi:hypothetical protein